MAEKRAIDELLDLVESNNKKQKQSSSRLYVPKKLNEEQQRIYDYVTRVKKFAPIFVSGSAGTGKSALLIAIRDWCRAEKKVVWIVSYTNLAARNIEGKTIHSMFKFDFNLNISNYRINAPEFLIIDEISMVPAKMLNGIDAQLKRSTGEDAAFGGVNTIVFGDLYQLPPVENRFRQNFTLPPYHSHAWSDFRLFNLTINMRQSEELFIKALNLLRKGDASCQDFFNSKVIDQEPCLEEKINCTSLVSTHLEANHLNNICYEYVKSKSKDKKEYQVKLIKTLEKRHTTSMPYNKSQEEMIFKDNIKYCVGTRVMITLNVRDFVGENSFCNGDIGTIVQVSDECLTIKREWDGTERKLTMHGVLFETEDKNVLKTVYGLPITYGWAVTIHKAQGMTLRNLIVYPAKTFVAGQAYVALSRATHCDGLILVDPIPANSIKNMREVDKVYEEQIKFQFTEEEPEEETVLYKESIFN
ncbi:ORF116 [Agrotis segetum granulovirus]|uniref:Helicase-2 n=1 Tax=Agrotis segetum granulosis virus TaxID=10464 RepID=Q6QXH6_GVAS|nr:DNA helicase-2 [Agrotis segetum granulovirus]AAS82622.1 ORF116 [Agrotis segetum granulovirus]AHN92167.1 helicase-2 [Agrotis segetum granulovirus]AKN63405.1 DNA helicase-2 [Agrotis segetum granulovirus]